MGTAMDKTRCAWVGHDPLYQAYHDTEWGVPQRDEHALFECLLLEGAQAGLSWITVLRKRERYREVFDGFDPVRIARYDAAKKAELLADAGIIRHRGKIDAAVVNAQVWLRLREEGIDPVAWLWAFVGGQPQRRESGAGAPPSHSAVSDAMSKALKQRGFKFVGSTICYAFMQATGMVDDHAVDCFCHRARGGSAAG